MTYMKNQATWCFLGSAVLAAGTAMGCGYCAVLLAGGAAALAVRYLVAAVQPTACSM